MLDVNLRLRGVQVSEVAEDPAVTLMSRVAADGGGSLRPGCGGIGPNGVRETVLIWGDGGLNAMSAVARIWNGLPSSPDRAG